MKSLIPSYAGENSVSGNGEGRQRNQEKKILVVPLYSGASNSACDTALRGEQ